MQGPQPSELNLMNIIIQNLDNEQQSALEQLSAGHASSEEWGAAVLLGLIEERVNRNIDDKGAELLAQTKQLPKEKRLSFTSQTETLLTTLLTEP